MFFHSHLSTEITSHALTASQHWSLLKILLSHSLTHWAHRCKTTLSWRLSEGASWVKGRRGRPIHFKRRFHEERIALCWVNPPSTRSASTTRPGPQLRLVKVGEGNNCSSSHYTHMKRLFFYLGHGVKAMQAIRIADWGVMAYRDNETRYAELHGHTGPLSGKITSEDKIMRGWLGLMDIFLKDNVAHTFI